jgi:predicted RNase H-like nuclease (RuvC/YqgF family)
MGKKFSIKSLFVEGGNDSSTEQPQAIPKPSAPAAAPITRGVPSPVIAPLAGSGQEDPQIRDSLFKALEDANQEGYDYFEFAKAVEQQKAFIDAEQIRFQSTYTAAAVMGVTPDKLIASAQQYQAVLQAKEKEFLAALDQNRSSEIDKKKKEILAVNENITQKAEHINRLTQEISDLNRKKVQLDAEVQASEQKIGAIQANFYTSLKAITSKILTDIEKIKQYLVK